MFTSFPRLAFLAGFPVAFAFGPAFAFAAALFAFAFTAGLRARAGLSDELGLGLCLHLGFCLGAGGRRSFRLSLLGGPFGSPVCAAFGRPARRGQLGGAAGAGASAAVG